MQMIIIIMCVNSYSFGALNMKTWCALAAMTVSLPLFAADAEVSVSIQNHVFEPAELRVPAGRRIKLVVNNRDSTAEEFESHELNREKLIPAGGTATIYVGPLTPGRYPFFGEFHEKTARGLLVAE